MSVNRHHVLEISPLQWMSVFMEWSSGVGTGKECMASGDPVKPLTSLLAHKQESALCHLLKTFVDRLLQAQDE